MVLSLLQCERVCPDGTEVADGRLCAHYDCPDGSKAVLPRLCTRPTPIPTVSPLPRVVIESCPHEITSPGNYVLEADLEFTSRELNATCITVGFGGNGSTIDCQGNSINGPGPPPGYRPGAEPLDDFFGILLRNASGVTVRNCNVAGFSTSIYLVDACGNALINNTARANLLAGISIEGYEGQSCDGNVLIGNKVDGIYISFSNNNVLYGNVVNTNDSERGRGITLAAAANNTLIGNNASGNWYGISMFLGANGNILVGNMLSSNKYGVTMGNVVDSNFFMDNYACGNTEDVACEGASHAGGGSGLQTDGGNTCARYAGPETCGISCNSSCGN